VVKETGFVEIYFVVIVFVLLGELDLVVGIWRVGLLEGGVSLEGGGVGF
jgi:hypothetical protein